MEFLSNIGNYIWSFVSESTSYDDDLTLHDTENGQCYTRRRTPEARKELQTIKFNDVSRARRRRSIRLASLSNTQSSRTSEQKPLASRQTSQKCATTSRSKLEDSEFETIPLSGPGVEASSCDVSSRDQGRPLATSSPTPLDKKQTQPGVDYTSAEPKKKISFTLQKEMWNESAFTNSSHQFFDSFGLQSTNTHTKLQIGRITSNQPPNSSYQMFENVDLANPSTHTQQPSNLGELLSEHTPSNQAQVVAQSTAMESFDQPMMATPPVKGGMSKLFSDEHHNNSFDGFGGSFKTIRTCSPTSVGTTFAQSNMAAFAAGHSGNQGFADDFEAIRSSSPTSTTSISQSHMASYATSNSAKQHSDQLGKPSVGAMPTNPTSRSSWSAWEQPIKTVDEQSSANVRSLQGLEHALDVKYGQPPPPHEQTCEPTAGQLPPAEKPPAHDDKQHQLLNSIVQPNPPTALYQTIMPSEFSSVGAMPTNPTSRSSWSAGEQPLTPVDEQSSANVRSLQGLEPALDVKYGQPSPPHEQTCEPTAGQLPPAEKPPAHDDKQHQLLNSIVQPNPPTGLYPPIMPSEFSSVGAIPTNPTSRSSWSAGEQPLTPVDEQSSANFRSLQGLEPALDVKYGQPPPPHEQTCEPTAGQLPPAEKPPVHDDKQHQLLNSIVQPNPPTGLYPPIMPSEFSSVGAMPTNPTSRSSGSAGEQPLTPVDEQSSANVRSLQSLEPALDVKYGQPPPPHEQTCEPKAGQLPPAEKPPAHVDKQQSADAVHQHPLTNCELLNPIVQANPPTGLYPPIMPSEFSSSSEQLSIPKATALYPPGMKMPSWEPLPLDSIHQAGTLYPPGMAHHGESSSRTRTIKDELEESNSNQLRVNHRRPHHPRPNHTPLKNPLPLQMASRPPTTGEQFPPTPEPGLLDTGFSKNDLVDTMARITSSLQSAPSVTNPELKLKPMGEKIRQLAAESLVTRDFSKAVDVEPGSTEMDTSMSPRPSNVTEPHSTRMTHHDGGGNQIHQTPPIASQRDEKKPSPVGIPSHNNQSIPSGISAQSNVHHSAFVPVKPSSPYGNLESPLRSPVQREKQETLAPSPRFATSSLWDAPVQLAILGLIVPTARTPNKRVPVSADGSLQANTNFSPHVANSGLPGFVQTTYLGDKSASQVNEPGMPTNQKLHSRSSLNNMQHSDNASSSDLSRQSSLGVSTSSQDLHASGGIVPVVNEKLSALIRGNNQWPQVNRAPSVNERPSSGRIPEHHYPQSAPPGPHAGISQHPFTHPDASRSVVHTGAPQDERARVREGVGGGVAPGFGGNDGHVDRPAGTSGGHGDGQSEGLVTQHISSSGVQNQQQLEYQQQQQRQQHFLQQQQHDPQQPSMLQKHQQQHGQQHIEHQQLSEHDHYVQQQQQLQQQEQQQQSMLQKHQQQHGEQHMEHQQLSEHDHNLQQQQQLQQHQELQRQASGQYQQEANSYDTQYQTSSAQQQQQQQQEYEDYDSSKECNRYYDESRKWFWSHKQTKWIRADESKRNTAYQDQRYHDDRYRNLYEDDDRDRRHRRRRDSDPRRHSRGRSDYDDHYRAYYDKYYRDYYQREYRKDEDSSDSSAGSQRHGSRSGHSSRGQSPHSTSSRSSSRARKSSRRSKHGKSYDYNDGYRNEDDHNRSHQTSRSCRRHSSSVSSSTSNSLSEDIKWGNESKRQDSTKTTTEPTIEQAVTPERLTPKVHTQPHMVCNSRMGIAPARRVLDGESPEVFLGNVTVEPKSSQLMQSFPGPLCRGKTHKRDVVKFAKEMALVAFNNQSKTFEEREAGYILWEVLAVMVQQSGVYLNSDIAEVLMNELPRLPEGTSVDQEQSHPSSRRVSFGSESHSSVGHNQDILATYRDLLLCGKTQDALEFAISSKMWGHALTLAYQLDQNIFFNIMSRFTSNLTEDDSLLCLYQHLSQKRPSVLDKKSRRWRKHLAIMISNPSKSPAQDRKNIDTLGENLESRGLIEAAHLCYILAGKPVSKDSGMALLGYSLDGVRPEFVDVVALQRTEIYEYAMNLKDEGYIIKDFQPWKEFYAHSLADAGLHTRAYRYCKVMVDNILRNPPYFTQNTIQRLHSLTVRLCKSEFTSLLNLTEKLKKLHELIPVQEDMPESKTSSQQQASTNYYQSPPAQAPDQSASRHDMPYEPAVNPNGNQTLVQENVPSQAQAVVNQAQNSANGEVETPAPTNPAMFVPNNPNQAGANFVPQPETAGQNYQYNMSYTQDLASPEQVPQPGNYPYGNVSATEAVPSSVGYEATGFPGRESSEVQFFGEQSAGNTNFYGGPSAGGGQSTNFYEGDSFEHLLRKEPSGTSIGQGESSGVSTSKTNSSFDYYGQSNFRAQNDTKAESAKKDQGSSLDSKEQEKNEKKDDNKKENKSGGWSFGRFFKALFPKGKNEIILPDDKKKKIYWDEKLGKWINTEEGEETKADLPPPPINSSFISGAVPSMSAIPLAGQPTPTSGTSSGNHFNQPNGPLLNTPQPLSVQAPPAIGSFTLEQPEVSLINSPLSTPSPFSRRAHGSKGRKSNYVDVLSASGSTTRPDQSASPMLFQPFPTPPGNQAPMAHIAGNQANTDGTPRPANSENIVDNTMAEQSTMSQASQPPPSMQFFNPANVTPTSSSSGGRGRQYPGAPK